MEDKKRKQLQLNCNTKLIYFEHRIVSKFHLNIYCKYIENQRLLRHDYAS